MCLSYSKRKKKPKPQSKEIFYYYSAAVKKKIMVIIPQYLRMFKKLTADGRIKVERGTALCHVTLQRAAAVTLKGSNNPQHGNRALCSCYQESRTGQHPQMTSSAVNSMLVIKTFAFVERAFQTHLFPS